MPGTLLRSKWANVPRQVAGRAAEYVVSFFHTMSCHRTVQAIKGAHLAVLQRVSDHQFVQAIKRAHEDVKPGMLQVTAGELLDANANRSPTAYLANPPEERARYKHNTDKSMTLLKVMDTEDRQDCCHLCRI